HLRLRAEGKVEEDIARNYHPSALLLSLTAARHGHDGVRESAAELDRDIPNARFAYDEVKVNGSVAMLVWSGTSADRSVNDGTDSFVVEEGRITVQTIHYHVTQR